MYQIMEARLSACMYNSLYSLVRLNQFLNKENGIAVFLILVAMTLPLVAKIGSVAIILTGSVLIGTLLYLVIEHNRQIEELQNTISSLCLMAMEREHHEDMANDD